MITNFCTFRSLIFYIVDLNNDGDDIWASLIEEHCICGLPIPWAVLDKVDTPKHVHFGIIERVDYINELCKINLHTSKDP